VRKMESEKNEEYEVAFTRQFKLGEFPEEDEK
jgi:hypothetical protein